MLLCNMYDNLDEEMSVLAERAENNDQHIRYLEILSQLKTQRKEVEQTFNRFVIEGFENFAKGKIESSAPSGMEKEQLKLTLVDQGVHEKELAIDNVVNQACSTFFDQLFALNRRLAIVNGGTKLGKRNAALPTGPRHVCNGFVKILEHFDLDIEKQIALISLFEKFVVSQAGEIYDEFNTLLREAGILPNLRNEYGVVVNSGIATRHRAEIESPQSPNHSTPAAIQQRPTGQPNRYATGNDDAYGQQLINEITTLLAQRHHQGTHASTGFSNNVGHATVPQTSSTILSKFISELSSLQSTSVSAVSGWSGSQIQNSIGNVNAVLEEQTTKLAKILKSQHLPAPETGVIDLVGMLFDFILNDKTMPDSAKALLGHLHTPYLKIAILDRKFFSGDHHPARRLLNNMSEAGSNCSPDDSNDVSIIANIQQIVNRVLKEFDDNVSLFEELQTEFSEFIDSFKRRAKLIEKRSIATSLGRDKLLMARQFVSEAIIDRCVDQAIPKPIETMLMGPWANFLVISVVRHGKNSREWKSAIGVTDNLIWSIQPKSTPAERKKLRDLLPKIVDSVRAGLDLAGESSFNVDTLLDSLAQCHKTTLASKKQSKNTDYPGRVSDDKASRTKAKTEHQNPEDARRLAAERKAKWREIIPKEWQLNLNDDLDEIVMGGDATTVTNLLTTTLKDAKIGTWFEFSDPDKKNTQRGKLSWINDNSSTFMFVNRAGKQIAKKSQFKLAKEIKDGQTKILSYDNSPLLIRALNSIHHKLKKESKGLA